MAKCDTSRPPLLPRNRSRALGIARTPSHVLRPSWQSGIDPDDIFGQKIHEQDEACDLGDIFGKEQPSKRFHRRTSSGNWSQDRLTEPEEKIYKQALGFFR